MCILTHVDGIDWTLGSINLVEIMPHIQECTADQRVEGILLFLGLVPNQSTDIHEVIATGHFLNKLSYLFIKLP